MSDFANITPAASQVRTSPLSSALACSRRARSGTVGGVGVVIQCHLVGVPPGGPSGSLEYVYDTVTHTGGWNCDYYLQGLITTAPPPDGVPYSGDVRATYRYQTAVTQFWSTPGIGQTWTDFYGTANGTRDELWWKWTYQFDYRRSLGPVEIVAEAPHLGGTWYHWILEADGTATTVVDTGVPLHGYSSPFVQVGDMIGAVETEGGSGSATYDVTNPSPPGAASANNSVFEVTAAYPAGSFAGGDAGFTYHSRLEISRSNICSIDPADALNGSGPYEACKDILDQIDLGDLEREYSLFGDPATAPSPTKLEIHKIYLIRPTWPVDGYGSAINGRPFYWAISPIFGFWDETHGVEIGAPNGDLISTSSWENFKVHIYQTNAGGLLAAQNQWVQGTETNLGSHYNGALILSKARAIEDVQAGHVFYPENRPRESLGWTTDTGIPTNIDGFGSYDQFPTSPTPCHSVGNGDLRFEVPGYGVGVIYRRAQHAFYTTYDETTGEYIEHERPACWNWPPCIGCEEGI